VDVLIGERRANLSKGLRADEGARVLRMQIAPRGLAFESLADGRWILR
jgi:hypothetical protein